MGSSIRQRDRKAVAVFDHMVIGQHEPVGREHDPRAMPARPPVRIAHRDMRDRRTDARDGVHDTGRIGIEVFRNIESRIEWHAAHFGIDRAVAGPGRISGGQPVTWPMVRDARSCDSAPISCCWRSWMAEGPSNPLVAFSAALATLVAATTPRAVGVRAKGVPPLSGTLWRPDVVVAAEQVFPDVNEVEVLHSSGARSRARVTGRDHGTNVVALRLG